MPLRTIRQETDATFAFTGAGWASSASLAGSSGGALQRTTSAGALCTITLPANHGFTGGVLYGYGWGDGSPDSAITVDGVTVQAAWSQKFGASGDAHYVLPRILSYPFKLNPAKGSTQIIQLTTGTGFTRIDGMELYQAASPVAGRIVRFGMSMEYPVIDSLTLGPNTSGHGQMFVSYLNSTKYLGNVWTDVNQSVPSEALCYGSASSGVAGGPNSAPTYTQFAVSEFYPNTAIFTPGWMRAEAGELWPSPAPALGSALFTTNAQYMAGLSQWFAQLGQYYLFFHGFNDVGFSTHYDAPPDDVTANGASALATIFTLTAGSPAPTTTFTISDGTHPLTLSPASDIPSMNAGAVSAGFPYTFVSNSGHGTGTSALAIAGDVVTATANTRGASVVTRTANSNNGGVNIATTQTGRGTTAAGAGYGLARFIQRVRETMIRIALAITPCPTVLYIGLPNSANGGTVFNGWYPIYDAAMRDLMVEPWIPAITGGYPFKFVPIIGPMSGHPCNISATDPHQNNAGHYDIYLQLVRAHEQMLATSYTPSSSYRG